MTTEQSITSIGAFFAVVATLAAARSLHDAKNTVGVAERTLAEAER